MRLGHSERGLNPTGWYRDRLAIAKGATDFVKGLDPTRVVLHHAGAVAGDIYSANTYLNLLPLQEREEWLSAWAKDGDMPVMAVEFGLPLFFTGLRGRAKYTVAKSTEPLFTEFAAMVLGPEAYTLETDEYRRHIAEWHLGDGEYRDWWFEHSLDPAWIELQRLFIRNTWRSWRTYGVSGGMVPWAYTGPFEHWWKGPKQKVDFTPGQRGYHFAEVPAPLLDGKTGEWQRVQPRIEALRAANQPTLAYLGGDPADSFTAKGHHVYGGETITRSVVLINDSRSVQPYEVSCVFAPGLKNPQKQSMSGELAVGEIAVLPVGFDPPTVDERQDVSIELIADIGGTEHRDAFESTMFPPPASDAASGVPTVLIHDPEGDTAAMLERLGVRAEAWDGRGGERWAGAGDWAGGDVAGRVAGVARRFRRGWRAGGHHGPGAGRAAPCGVPGGAVREPAGVRGAGQAFDRGGAGRREPARLERGGDAGARDRRRRARAERGQAAVRLALGQSRERELGDDR